MERQALPDGIFCYFKNRPQGGVEIESTLKISNIYYSAVGLDMKSPFGDLVASDGLRKLPKNSFRDSTGSSARPRRILSARGAPETYFLPSNFCLLTNFDEMMAFCRGHCPLQNGSFLVRNSYARGRCRSQSQNLWGAIVPVFMLISSQSFTNG